MICFSMGFPGGSDGKESACNARDLGFIPVSRRSPEEGMVTHSNILAWRIPWTEKPGEGSKELDLTFTFLHVSAQDCIEFKK